MRIGWVVWGVFFLSFAAELSAAPPRSASPITTAEVTTGVRAVLTADYDIELLVKPHAGDAWTRLARRVTGDASNWEELASLNNLDENLKTHQTIRIPFRLLRADLRRDAVRSLFPSDRSLAEGWKHTVVGGRGIEGESLWKISEWLTGDGANYSLIRKANPTQGLSTRKGDVILVPKRLLTAAFGGSSEEENAPKTAAAVRQPQDDAAQRAAADENIQEATPVALGPAALTYAKSGSDAHAVYRLQKGEALYSSVAIRFTGRVFAKDVYDVLDRIVKYNDIADVSKIPVGYPVKIPMDLLLPEFRPDGDPTRVAAEASKRESALASKRTRAAGLSGVHVIVDAGHGGRDVGTEHDDVWESTYVYDVALRLRQILEKESAAKVSLTTRSKEKGYTVVNRNVLPRVTDHYVQTTPRYLLDDAIVGVNLRWYLANSIFRRALKSGAEPNKVVFLSIHADSLHPSLRGAMAYIPGAGYVTGSTRKRGDVYLARAEVREQPHVVQSRADAVEAEGLSRDFAETLIQAFAKNDLNVHPYAPVRDNVIRNGKEWVPAVIRHNVVPTRVLLEVCNLGNKKDRELMKTKAYRQEVAEAIYAGIVDFYATSRSAPLVAGKAAR